MSRKRIGLSLSSDFESQDDESESLQSSLSPSGRRKLLTASTDMLDTVSEGFSVFDETGSNVGASHRTKRSWPERAHRFIPHKASQLYTPTQLGLLQGDDGHAYACLSTGERVDYVLVYNVPDKVLWPHEEDDHDEEADTEDKLSLSDKDDSPAARLAVLAYKERAEQRKQRREAERDRNEEDHEEHSDTDAQDYGTLRHGRRRSTLRVKKRKKKKYHSASAVHSEVRRQAFETRLRRKGLVLEREYAGKHGTTVYVKIHAPFSVLCDRAERFQYRMPLKSTNRQLDSEAIMELRSTTVRFLRKFLPKWVVATLTFSGHADKTTPASVVHSAVFSLKHADKFLNWPDDTRFFSSSQRSLLLFRILQHTRYNHIEHKVGIARLLRNGHYTAAFPLHDSTPRRLDHEDRKDIATMQKEQRKAEDKQLKHIEQQRKLRKAGQSGTEAGQTFDSAAEEPLASASQPGGAGNLGELPTFTKEQPDIFITEDGKRKLVKPEDKKETSFGFSNGGSSRDASQSHGTDDSASRRADDGELDEASVQTGAVEEKARSRGMRAVLYERWGRFGAFSKAQPFNLIRRYFGEKIALYFAWLGFYTTWLLPVSALGLIVMVYGLAQFEGRTDTEELCNSNITMCALCEECDTWELSQACSIYRWSYLFDNEATIAFAFIMSLWATAFVDYWKRANSELAFLWDVEGVTEFEPQRADFRPIKRRPNPVTEVIEGYYPSIRRNVKYIFSFSAVMVMCAVVIIVLIATIAYRIAVNTALLAARKEEGDESYSSAASLFASFSAAIINLLCILVLNKVYEYLAFLLTKWENHSRDSKFEQHLTFKIFVFQFVNIYSSLFYIAFFKQREASEPPNFPKVLGLRADSCPAYGCLMELTIQLAVIMVGKQAFNNVMEIGLPMLTTWVSNCSAIRRRRKGEDRGLLPWEKDHLQLADYPSEGLFYEYLEMCVQFGFITLFVTSFPLAPLFALINNILEIRVDAKKMLTVYRRPPAYRADNIGIWSMVLDFISVCSVLTNGLVIAVTSEFVNKLVYSRETGGLEGYIESTVAPSPLSNSTIYPNQADCFYSAMRDDNGERPKLYYEIWVAKLAFFIAFEHVVFVLKSFTRAVIFDVPKWVRVAKRREAYLARATMDGLKDPQALEAQSASESESETETEARQGRALELSPLQPHELHASPATFYPDIYSHESVV